MLGDLPVSSDDRVLVDYRTADDAGVYRLDAERALVQTVDFFTPIVDDPYVYGEIAAANALSDVYAMGGRPLTALAVAGFPKEFEHAVLKAIFAGGVSKLQEAGVALLGGHTVQDTEVKFGYAVTGLTSPDAVWTNAGAKPGDVLVLTKPLGTGVIATAAKFDRTDPETLAAAMTSMQRTNRAAADALRAVPDAVHGCTDVTGFGLAGHACELATASDVTVEIDLAAVPLLPGARGLALGNRTGGMVNNRKHFGTAVVEDPDLPADLVALAFDPQTSGGLLASVAGSAVDTVLASLAAHDVAAVVVGTVTSPCTTCRVRLRQGSYT